MKLTLSKIDRYEKDLASYRLMLIRREERHVNSHGASVMLNMTESDVKFLCNEKIINHEINNDQYYIKIKDLQKILDDIKLLKQKHKEILKCLNKIP